MHQVPKLSPVPAALASFKNPRTFRSLKFLQCLKPNSYRDSIVVVCRSTAPEMFGEQLVGKFVVGFASENCSKMRNFIRSSFGKISNIYELRKGLG